jgi:hypothetical protein
MCIASRLYLSKKRAYKRITFPVTADHTPVRMRYHLLGAVPALLDDKCVASLTDMDCSREIA